MDVAGEMVTDIAGYLGLADLPSVAEFPIAMLAFKDVLSKVCVCYRGPQEGKEGGREALLKSMFAA